MKVPAQFYGMATPSAASVAISESGEEAAGSQQDGLREANSLQSDENKRPDQNSQKTELRIKRRSSDGGLHTNRRHAAPL